MFPSFPLSLTHKRPHTHREKETQHAPCEALDLIWSRSTKPEIAVNLLSPVADKFQVTKMINKKWLSWLQTEFTIKTVKKKSRELCDDINAQSEMKRVPLHSLSLIILVLVTFYDNLRGLFFQDVLFSFLCKNLWM